MRPKLLINDLHLGVQRTAGTTQQSAYDLRQHLQAMLRKLIMEHTDKDIIINGDLFDAYNVPMADVLDFYLTACLWLNESEGDLWLGAGNHDLSKDSSRLSSFEFVAEILQAQYPARVQAVVETAEIYPGIVMVPHCANQDIFNMQLESLECENSSILLHANWANDFAANSDHSLNVVQSQAKRLIERGNRLVFGHEHVARKAFAGKLICTGNQFPSSVADCLGNDMKYANIIGADGSITPVPTWDGSKHFLELPWDELDLTREENESFVRVCGNATAEQAGDVIAAISKYRQKSRAFVVTNAVKIEGSAEMSELPQSIETAKTFDVLAYLYENLSAEEGEVVQQLLTQAEPMKEAA